MRENERREKERREKQRRGEKTRGEKTRGEKTRGEQRRGEERRGVERIKVGRGNNVKKSKLVKINIKIKKFFHCFWMTKVFSRVSEIRQNHFE